MLRCRFQFNILFNITVYNLLQEGGGSMNVEQDFKKIRSAL
jgi:hypothetical protein